MERNALQLISIYISPCMYLSAILNSLKIKMEQAASKVKKNTGSNVWIYQETT